MSSTEVYGITKGGECVVIGTTHNSFRGAMRIWKHLEDKYLPPFIPEWAKNTSASKEKWSRCATVETDNMKEIWELFNSNNTSRVEDIVLGSTFDNVIVLKENFDELITAFREFEVDTTLPQQADIIEENRDNIIGVCWNQTTVCMGWHSPDRYHECDVDLDEEDREPLPYNIYKDDIHWNLFDDLVGKKFRNVCEAYSWIMDHPKLVFEKVVEPWIDLTPHMVNPETREVDEDSSLNTHLEWWIEGGGHSRVYDFDKNGSVIGHNDYDLHTGGDTADEAVINFAQKVFEKHGDYEEREVTKEELEETLKKLGINK